MRTFLIVALFVALISAENLRANKPVIPTATDCSDASYLIHYGDISVTEMNRGQPMTLDSGESTIDKDVTAASVQVTAVTSGATVLDKTVSACGDAVVDLPLGLGKIQVNSPSCPIAAGTVDSTIMKCTLPIITPSGNYNIRLDAKTDKGEKLYCLNVAFKL
ncbi:hypothetical protein WA158_000383 [Blastocystis sp. Blastoise]